MHLFLSTVFISILHFQIVMWPTFVMQNSQWSNAGFGSNLTLTGTVECDASVMDGNSLLFGAVGAVSGSNAEACKCT